MDYSLFDSQIEYNTENNNQQPRFFQSFYTPPLTFRRSFY